MEEKKMRKLLKHIEENYPDAYDVARDTAKQLESVEIDGVNEELYIKTVNAFELVVFTELKY